MKYLHSAMTSSAKPLMPPQYVFILKWGGIVLYVSTIFVLYLCDIITWPGNPDYTD